jgi:hypothetical protein
MDIWNGDTQEWKNLSDLKMHFHASNRSSKDIIIGSIPWRPDSFSPCAQPGDWVSTPSSGTPLEWVYYVLEALADKVLVLEFRRIASSGQIRATNFQKLIIRPDNLSLIRVLLRERHGASLKVANDPPLANQRNKTYWIFESGIIKNLPWDPREWHWKEVHPLGDAPFFGYTDKRGYRNVKSSSRSLGIITFIDNLNLKNSSTSQVVARIWHNSRPRKVGTLIWLTLNQGLPTGTWLQVMGISPTCTTCSSGAPESPQHCLLDCPPAQHAWGAFKRVWEEWKAPEDVTFNWPFALLGEASIEHEEDPRACTLTTQEGTLTSSSCLTFYAPSSYTTFGPRDVVSTSTTATPSTKSSRKPGWPPSKSAWPPGRPSGPLGRSMTLLCKLGLSSPLDLNGFI